MTKTFHPKCLELAEFFFELPANATRTDRDMILRHRNGLAQAIQNAVENYLFSAHDKVSSKIAEVDDETTKH